MIEQRTDEWFLQRKGKITSSEVAAIIGKGKSSSFTQTGLSYLDEKVDEALTSDDEFIFFNNNYNFSNKAMDWGTMYEPFARDYYSEKYDIEVAECGFVEYSELSGGSPDGSTYDNGVIEIKCPFNGANHIQFLKITTAEELKALNPKYYWQCVMNTLITGSDYCDFISYDKRKKEHLRMAVIRVKRDEKEMLLLRERLVEAEKYITDSINKIYGNIL